jgi:hypothetical protein
MKEWFGDVRIPGDKKKGAIIGDENFKGTQITDAGKIRVSFKKH